MASVFKRLWWYLTLPKGWDTVKRTMSHPAAGDLRYDGKRDRPGGYVHGVWKLSRPDLAKPITVSFPTFGDEPTDRYLGRLATLLADQDALFERFRSAIEPEYLAYTQSPLPSDWRSAFRLDILDAPPFPDDVDEDGALWQVGYWCEPAQHWFIVHLDGEKVIDVEVAG